jgi:hypothetical protein
MRPLATLLLLGGCAAAPTATADSVSGRVMTRYGPVWKAFVYVESGLEGRPFEPPAASLTLDQRGYEFIPRVFGLRVGQTLRITSSDPTHHNVRCDPFDNDGFNLMLHEHEVTEKRFHKREIMVELRCDLHPHMKSYIGVLEHPFFAVTGTDGLFELRGLPPGDYVIAAWSEDRGLKRIPVSLRGRGADPITFSF